MRSRQRIAPGMAEVFLPVLLPNILPSFRASIKDQDGYKGEAKDGGYEHFHSSLLYHDPILQQNGYPALKNQLTSSKQKC